MAKKLFKNSQVLTDDVLPLVKKDSTLKTGRGYKSLRSQSLNEEHHIPRTLLKEHK